MNGIAPASDIPTDHPSDSTSNKRKFNDVDFDQTFFRGDSTHWQQASDWEFFGADLSDLMTFDSM